LPIPERLEPESPIRLSGDYDAAPARVACLAVDVSRRGLGERFWHAPGYARESDTELRPNEIGDGDHLLLTRRRPDPADACRTRDIDEFCAVTGKP
jgi:hypothetical protein